MQKTKPYLLQLTFSIISIIFLTIAFESCTKDTDCKECKECELNAITGEYDQNCGSYKEYCGEALRIREAIGGAFQCQ